MRYRYLTLCIVASLSLSACAPLIIGSVVGGSAAVLADRRMATVQASDRSMQLEAERMLAQKLGKDASIEVSVFNRKLLLTGEVTSAAYKQEAEAMVHQEQSPREIINELNVGPLSSLGRKVGDASVTSAVKAAFIATRDVPSNSMRITTHAGTVYLMGLVTPLEGKAAAYVASGVIGVKQVVKLFEYIDEPLKDTKATTSQVNENSTQPH